MAAIKDALSALPARPALYIAPLLVVLVLTLYYRDLYHKCDSIRQHRLSLNELLQQAQGSGQFRLVDFANFTWNKVRIVASVDSGTISDECPFGWNWRSGERESLLAAGLLTALIFGHEGKVVRYLELRRDEVEFRGTEGNLTPESAVFTIGRASHDGPVTLTLDR